MNEVTFPRMLGKFEYGVFKIHFEIIEPMKFRIQASGFIPTLFDETVREFKEFDLAAKAFHRYTRQAIHRANESMVIYNSDLALAQST